MDKTDLPFLTASDLSRLIESKDVSPVEVTEAYLDRIDALDFKFNAYLTVTREQALSAAREAEREITGGNYRGPLHGVPVAVKDQLNTAGVRTTGGSRLLADFVPEEDATAIANLKHAGAILLGKTNMTEFAITGFSHRYSTPRNPWDLNVYTGGSSSGSGAATAAYMCATSLGEDTGGSIRFPAAWCGLVGLRPTWGLVSRYGVMTGVWSMDAVGPISRTVEDAAITLGAIAGHDPNDSHTFDRPVPDYRAVLGASISGLRVGIITEQMDSDLVEPTVREVVSRAISVLGELGANVDDVSIPLSNTASTVSSTLLSVEPALNHSEWIRENIHEYGHDDRILLLTGSILPAHYYYKAQKIRDMLRAQVLEALNQYDVLVLPTLGKSAQPVADDPVVTSKATAARLPYLLTRIFNSANCPAMSVPCGFDEGGLPIGLQIAGRPGSEETLFKVGHAYEQATEWHTMRPTEA